LEVTRILFITATDTGVGKTLLTAMLLHHLRQHACRALALKPFCSGGTADVELLHALQDGELTTREVNPFYFTEPVAPLVAARKHRRRITLDQVLRPIFQVAHRCKCLLVEGSGGLLVPLGEGFTVADLISALGCETIVVSRNRLGTINHTLLTVKALQHVGVQKLKVILMSPFQPDLSARSNAKILAELLGPVPLLTVPYLGSTPMKVATLRKNCKKIKKTLARILG
jgi:dethiobiotin synthetase